MKRDEKRLMEKLEVVVARMEQQLINLNANLEKYMEEQDKKNNIFFITTEAVTVLKAKADAGWRLICAFGTLTVTVSAGIAWIVSFVTGKP